jgi:hypothetical protein
VVTEYNRGIKYQDAAHVRILLAQFRELQSFFAITDRDPALLESVAESARAYLKIERLAAFARVPPFLFGVAVVCGIAIIVAVRAAIVLFDELWPALLVALVLFGIYIRGPESLVDNRGGRRWHSVLTTLIAVTLASPLIGAIAGFPGFLPEQLFLKWLIFVAGEAAIIHLLVRVFELVWWPLFGHRVAWLGRYLVSEHTLFCQLIRSAFLITKDYDEDTVFGSIEDAGATAQALHRGRSQRALERLF